MAKKNCIFSFGLTKQEKYLEVEALFIDQMYKYYMPPEATDAE